MKEKKTIVSKNGNKFFWSAYWHKWSRILEMMSDNVRYQIEVDLQPISTDRKINIRRHCTARAAGDIVADEISVEVVEGMRKRFGDELTERLLHEDFLPNINWKKYEKRCNGGAEFDLIKKDA